MALANIGSIVDSLRRRRTDGTPEPFEQSWLWPVYAPFHPVRTRWNDLKERGKLTPELADELQVEAYQAAHSLLGDSRSHRPQRALGVYERGRLRQDQPQAVVMSNLIIGVSSGRLKHSREPGTRIMVSAVEAEPPTELDV